MSKTPGNFQPGEYTLIGLIAARYREAAQYYQDVIEDKKKCGLIVGRSDPFFPIVAVTLRRMAHYRLHGYELELLRREMVYEAIQDHRFMLLQSMGVSVDEILIVLSSLGCRHMVSRVSGGRVS
jgi:hypothetical protein